MKPTKQRVPDKKIEAILAAARELFATQGFDQTPVSEVAEKADVAAGTIIYHFKTKENLLFVLAWDALNSIFRLTLNETKTAATGLEGVESYVRCFYDYLQSNPNDCVIFLKYKNFDSTTKWVYSDINFDILYHRYVNLLQDILGTGISDGSIRDISVHDAAIWIFSVLIGSAWMVLFRKENPELQRVQSLAFIKAALLNNQ